ncbi:hypothetical protein ACJ73_06402 [Blastomyces percursus]|uniref:glucose oxidase n=1 Tax=Blastomyces percursus TaxID=1658174 RepID=A0A1J9QPX9_9EURO|nr:hypothetical protein ACJ73_06402 [Blastomyces percursus]
MSTTRIHRRLHHCGRWGYWPSAGSKALRGSRHKHSCSRGGSQSSGGPRCDHSSSLDDIVWKSADWEFAIPTLAGKTIRAAQGKWLGGSSAINVQALISASKAILDAWSNLGNEGWTWENLQPYYRKSYTLNLPDEKTREHLGLKWVDPSIHGFSRPMQVSFPGQVQNPLVKAWVDMSKNIGYGRSVLGSFAKCRRKYARSLDEHEVIDGVVTGDPLLRQKLEAIQAAMKIYSEHKAGLITIGDVQSSALMPILELRVRTARKRRKGFFNQFLSTGLATSFQSIIRGIFKTHNEATCDMFMFLAQANLRIKLTQAASLAPSSSPEIFSV